MTAGNKRDFAVDATVDLTSKSVRWTARRSRTQAEPIVIEKTDDDGITVAVGTDGLATIHLVRADTVAIDRRTLLFWDLQVTSGSDVKTVTRGRLYVEPSISAASP